MPLNLPVYAGFKVKGDTKNCEKCGSCAYKLVVCSITAKSKVLNTKLINQIFPNFSMKLTNLDDGLRKVIEWFVKNRFYEK